MEDFDEIKQLTALMVAVDAKFNELMALVEMEVEFLEPRCDITFTVGDKAFPFPLHADMYEGLTEFLIKRIRDEHSYLGMEMSN